MADAHLVQFDGKDWSAPRLKALLSDSSVLKIFHFARFDLGVLAHYLKVAPEPVYCTKIASKLVRTYTDRHGLKDLCSELLGVELSKQQQSSDWAAEKLTDQQKQYAANDVLYLHALKAKLDIMLQREGRMAFAEACFRFLSVRAGLDLAGFEDVDDFCPLGRRWRRLLGGLPGVPISPKLIASLCATRCSGEPSAASR